MPTRAACRHRRDLVSPSTPWRILHGLWISFTALTESWCSALPSQQGSGSVEVIRAVWTQGQGRRCPLDQEERGPHRNTGPCLSVPAHGGSTPCPSPPVPPAASCGHPSLQPLVVPLAAPQTHPATQGLTTLASPQAHPGAGHPGIFPNPPRGQSPQPPAPAASSPARRKAKSTRVRKVPQQQVLQHGVCHRWARRGHAAHGAGTPPPQQRAARARR